MSNNGGSCPRCGGWVNGRFCGNCGAAVTPEAPAPSPPPPSSSGGAPKYVTALAAVLAIIALGAGGYLVVDHLSNGKQTQSTELPNTVSPGPTSEPSTSSSSTQQEQPGPSSESAMSNPAPSTVTETETQTREPSDDPEQVAADELNSWASSDSDRLDRNDTWGASLGMMWPGVKDAHIMGGKTMSASDILKYYRGLQDRFPGQTYLVRANQVGKQNSNHAAHPDAWQLLVPLNADDGKDADKWCRDNMDGDDTFTCARQKINDPH